MLRGCDLVYEKVRGVVMHVAWEAYTYKHWLYIATCWSGGGKVTGDTGTHPTLMSSTNQHHPPIHPSIPLTHPPINITHSLTHLSKLPTMHRSQNWRCEQCGLIRELVLPVTKKSQGLEEEAKRIGQQINLTVRSGLVVVV